MADRRFCLPGIRDTIRPLISSSHSVAGNQRLPSGLVLAAVAQEISLRRGNFFMRESFRS
jgi:hypothetical protein